VKRIVAFGKTIVPVAEAEVSSLIVVNNSKRCKSAEKLVTSGATVKVGTGPLAGITGYLVRRGSKNRVAISMNLLQRSVLVELDERDLVLFENDLCLGAIGTVPRCSLIPK
jgi:transcription antitermination factor NusG